jgi:hypothetical protein
MTQIEMTAGIRSRGLWVSPDRPPSLPVRMAVATGIGREKPPAAVVIARLVSMPTFCRHCMLFAGRCGRNRRSLSGRYLNRRYRVGEMKGKCDGQDRRSGFAPNLALARSEQ